MNVMGVMYLNSWKTADTPYARTCCDWLV